MRSYNFAFVFKDNNTTSVKVWSLQGYEDDSKEYLNLLKDRALGEIENHFSSVSKILHRDNLWVWDVNSTDFK